MRSSINISIPEPCGESWQKMTPVPGGRHCSVCKKCIADFTQSTDREIWKAYKKHGHLCGKFRPDQLDRTINPPQQKRMSLGVATAVALGISVPLSAQETQQNTSVCVPQEVRTVEPLQIGPVDSTKQHFKGQVFDEQTKEPLPFVNVLLFSEGELVFASMTDFDGHYFIPHSILDSCAIDQLRISFLGYSDVIKHFDPPLTSASSFGTHFGLEFMEVNLEVGALVGVVVVQRSPWYKRLWWRIIRPFR